jgi:hypothetical protein
MQATLTGGKWIINSKTWPKAIRTLAPVSPPASNGAQLPSATDCAHCTTGHLSLDINPDELVVTLLAALQGGCCSRSRPQLEIRPGSHAQGAEPPAEVSPAAE